MRAERRHARSPIEVEGFPMARPTTYEVRADGVEALLTCEPRGRTRILPLAQRPYFL
jgi:hypothetical protein